MCIRCSLMLNCHADHSAPASGESPQCCHIRSPVEGCKEGNCARLQPSEHEVPRGLCTHAKEALYTASDDMVPDQYHRT